jgi:hypothetical protein
MRAAVLISAATSSFEERMLKLKAKLESSFSYFSVKR